MKNNLLKFLLLFLSVLSFPVVVYCQKNYQPGYIINLYGDTIHGLINYRNWDISPGKILFKRSVDNETEYFVPLSIRGFCVANESYKSAIVKVDKDSYGVDNLAYSREFHYRVDTAFIKILIQGKKDLFQYKDMNSKEHFLIGQDTTIELLHYKKYVVDINGEKKVKEINNYKGQFAYYFRDCPGINEKLARVVYREHSLVDLFSEYYNCVGEKVGFIAGEKKSRCALGVLTGFSITKLKFTGVTEELVNTDYSSSANLSFGLFIDWFLPKGLNKLSINNELLYSSFNTNGEYSESDRATIYTTLEYSYLKVNSMLRYSYPVRGASIYLNAGMSNGFAIKETNYKRTVTFFPSDKVEEGKALDDTKKYEPGLIMGIGSKIGRLSVELRYEAGKGMSEYVNLRSPVKRVYFLFGFRL